MEIARNSVIGITDVAKPVQFADVVELALARRTFFICSACCMIQSTVISGIAGSQPSALACSKRSFVLNPGAIVTGSGAEERYTMGTDPSDRIRVRRLLRS